VVKFSVLKIARRKYGIRGRP